MGKALVDFDHAIRLDPEYKDAYFSRGHAKYNLGQYGEVIVDFDHVLRLDSEHIDAYYWRARAKYSLERYDEAIVDFDEAIHLSLEGARVYYWRGLSKTRLKQYPAAIADFDRAIRLESTDAYSHYHRGGAKFELERFAEAEVDLKEALSLAKQSDDDVLIGWILDLLKKITEPNDWSPTVIRATQRVTSEALSETQARQEQFWTQLRDAMVEKGSRVRWPKPSWGNFLIFSIGRTGFSMEAWQASRNKEIGIRLYLAGQDATAHFYLLKEQQAEIEKAFGEPLEWAEMLGRKSCRISLRKGDTDPTDVGDWPKQHEWLADKLERYSLPPAYPST